MTITLTEQVDERKLNLVFTDEKPREWASYPNYVLLDCPCCKKSWWEGYEDRGLYWRHTKNRAIWDVCKSLVMHMVCQIRLNGEVKHMKLLIKLFGKAKGRGLLKKYAKRSIIVSRNINKFLKTLR